MSKHYVLLIAKPLFFFSLVLNVCKSLFHCTLVTVAVMMCGDFVFGMFLYHIV